MKNLRTAASALVFLLLALLVVEYRWLGAQVEKTQAALNATRTRLKAAETELASARRDNTRLIAANLGIDATSPDRDLIVLLRDYVYRSTRVGPGDFNPGDPLGNFLALEHGKEMLCGGMAKTYSWLLAQFGITSRTVQLAGQAFFTGEAPGDTHVSVEVYDADQLRWYVSDPTFNVSFSCNRENQPLDFTALVACQQRGGEITPIENGMTYIEGRRIDDYYLPFEALLVGIRAVEVPPTANSPVKQAIERWPVQPLKQGHLKE